MRVGPEGYPALPNSTAPQSPPGVPTSIASSVPPPNGRPGSAYPISPDRVEQREPLDSGPFGAVGDWAKSEWSTVAGAAHGLASAPGIVSKAWRDAAQMNTHLSNSIRHTVDEWDHQTASGRQAAIDALTKTAAPVSKSAVTLAQELARANRFPLALEKVTTVAARGLPDGAKRALENVTRVASRAFVGLPAQVESQARRVVRDLDVAASSQMLKASGRLPTLSRVVGSTLIEVQHGLNANENLAKLLDKAPLLRDTPLRGFCSRALRRNTTLGTARASPTQRLRTSARALRARQRAPRFPTACLRW